MDLADLIGVLDKFQKELNEELSKYSTRQVAFYFAKGFPGSNTPLNTPVVENQRMLIRNYLSTKSEEYMTEFQKHLDDSLLGEREGDDFD